jgi:hypothetical protein
MSSQIIDYNAPSLQRGYPRTPESLPHGLISPPELVRELLAKEKAKHPPEVFNAECEERILNQYTIHYYFDYLGHEVVYRQTPAGPEVVAVGDEEQFALRQRIGEEEYRKFQTWLPY